MTLNILTVFGPYFDTESSMGQPCGLWVITGPEEAPWGNEQLPEVSVGKQLASDSTNFLGFGLVVVERMPSATLAFLSVPPKPCVLM